MACAIPVALLLACSASDRAASPSSPANGDSGAQVDDAGSARDASAPGDAGGAQVGVADTGASVVDDGDVFVDACEWGGAPGECATVSACAASAGHTSFAGECPGPASIECCIVTPSTADDPPAPTGYELMPQSQVTADMTTWAVAILDDPTSYPMFATTTKTFGTLTVLARVEWHPPDFQNSVVHRGVTLYEPG